MTVEIKGDNLGETSHKTPLMPFFFLGFIYFFLFVWLWVGLHCCVQAFSSCSKRGLLFIETRWLLTAVASLLVEHRL